MAYVRRNEEGRIINVYDSPEPGANEYLSIESEELISFLTQTDDADAARVALSMSDMALVRVLEDLINTLIDRGVILFTDLPPAAREKLANREKIRDQLNDLDNLMGDDQGLL
ncbi:hypothetical protein [Methylophaga sp. OBS1]|uniref:hypothetical protein n=1 Tax=Methylophaga sp. OBS1 TaxID=2991933 RepID=UPI0022529965|nr:hypothetical protein [Methylophaga sp. OBS1]MCX4193343.1 hypothetical protein [Methylophaga sp. OBS1]